jgi:hypothetical protein
MSVRFAPAYDPARITGWHAGWRGLVGRARAQVANDNPRAPGEAAPYQRAFDPILTDALHHFAVHGLGAVDAALDEAALADASGDAIRKDRWLAITHIFDRRRAAAAKAYGSAADILA